jgi:hypothetical protein
LSPLGLPKDIERRNAERVIFTPEVAKNFVLEISKAAPMITGAPALSPQDEPAVIKDFVRNSKGVAKYWVNYTPDGYVLTLLLPFSISLVNAATVRGYEIQAQRIRSALESQHIPVQMIIFRSSEGILFSAG